MMFQDSELDADVFPSDDNCTRWKTIFDDGDITPGEHIVFRDGWLPVFHMKPVGEIGLRIEKNGFMRRTINNQ